MPNQDNIINALMGDARQAQPSPSLADVVKNFLAAPRMQRIPTLPQPIDHASMSDMGNSANYRPLNLPNLLSSGAVRVTQPGDGRGGFDANDHPWDYSIVTHYNDLHGGTGKWPSKPSAHDLAAQQINQPGPLYNGKYNQILWSARQKGMIDNDIFLPQK